MAAVLALPPGAALVILVSNSVKRSEGQGDDDDAMDNMERLWVHPFL